MDEGLTPIHHPSILKGLNLLQTQSCHSAPHLSRLVSQVLNIPSFGDPVPAVTDTLSPDTEKWHRVEVKSSEKHRGNDSWATSFLNLSGSLFITALTWIMQDQTIVDISLIDSTPTVMLCYRPVFLSYLAWWFVCTAFTFFSLFQIADSLGRDSAHMKWDGDLAVVLKWQMHRTRTVLFLHIFVMVLYMPLTFN